MDFSNKKIHIAGHPSAGAVKPIVEAENLGIKYNSGLKRDDFQSISLNLLTRKKKVKKDFWALKNLDFSACTGDILGIIGSNGAGKTTICRVVSSLLFPDQGSFKSSFEVSALLSLGAGFNPQLTGRENVFLNGMMLGISKKEIVTLLPRIVEFSGLKRFIDQPLKIYSSGMRSRLGFSIAALMEPEILVIDEALSAGDLEFTEKAAQKMQQLVSQARLVMVVTHNTGFVESHCTRALWIEGGRVSAVGPPAEVVERYKETLPLKKARRKITLTQTEASPGSEAAVQVSDLGVQFKLNRTASDQAEDNSFLKRLNPWGKDSFWALQEVSFTVNEGEIVGIIGPNGAGKTTLCKALTGILKPDRGSVAVSGETTALLSLGTGVNHQLSGKDNIYLNGMMLGISKKRIASLFDDIVDFSGLNDKINQPVKHYSSGMRSRLGFSIAALLQPDVFIIDEALSAGDASFYEKASSKVQDLIEKAKAVIVVTHGMDFVETVCSRAIFLDQGMIKYDGDPCEAVALYRESVKKGKAAGN